MYQVNIENRGGYSFNVSSEGNDFCIDTKGKGISPPAALLASLGSCIGVYLNRYVEGVGLKPNGFKITVKAEISKEKPVGFREIYVSIDLNGQELDQRRKEAILTFIKNCPIHNTLKINPNIKMELI